MTLSDHLRPALLRRALPLLLIGGLALAPGAALAAMTQVTTLADLNANDLIRWRQVVPPGNIAGAFQRPVAVLSNNGVGATLSNASGPLHRFSVLPGSTQALPFDTTHGDPNDDILQNCCSSPAREGDITLNFTTPVRGFGAYILGNPIHFIGSVLVNGVSPFSVAGDYSIAEANHSVFLGVLSDAIDIYSITFTLTDDGDNNGLLEIDDLRLNTTAAPPVEPPSSPTPEPATWAMLILGFAGAGAALRRRPRQALAQG